MPYSAGVDSVAAQNCFLLISIALVEKSDTDQAKGADALTNFARTLLTDSSIVSDAIISRGFTAKDSVFGAEQTAGKSFILQDLSLGVEQIISRILSGLTDFGIGIDTFVNLAKVILKTGTDVGIGMETLSVLQRTLLDEGFSLEKLAERELQQSDLGTGIDSLAERALEAFDQGLGSELAAEFTRILTDSGLTLDQRKAREFLLFDQGLGVEKIVQRILEALSDYGIGLDIIVQLEKAIGKYGFDSAVGYDKLVAFERALADVATGLDFGRTAIFDRLIVILNVIQSMVVTLMKTKVATIVAPKQQSATVSLQTKQSSQITLPQKQIAEVIVKIKEEEVS